MGNFGVYSVKQAGLMKPEQYFSLALLIAMSQEKIGNYGIIEDNATISQYIMKC